MLVVDGDAAKWLPSSYVVLSLFWQAVFRKEAIVLKKKKRFTKESKC